MRIVIATPVQVASPMLRMYLLRVSGVPSRLKTSLRCASRSIALRSSVGVRPGRTLPPHSLSPPATCACRVCPLHTSAASPMPSHQNNPETKQNQKKRF